MIFAPPALRVLVNGHKIPERVWQQIESFEVTHHWDGADELQIRANGWDSQRAVYTILGEDIFQPGNEITVESGYGDIDTHHGRFEVMRHEPEFSGGRASVRIFAYDAMHRMVGPQSKQGRAFMFTQRDSDIVRTYAANYGFTPVIDDTEENPQFDRIIYKGHKPKHQKAGPDKVKHVYPSWIKEVGATDLEDCKVLAARNGYLPPRVKFVDGEDKFFFRKPLSLDAQMAEQPSARDGLMLWRLTPVVGNSVLLNAGTCTLQSFDPTYTLSGQPIAVRVVGRDDSGMPVVVEMEVEPGEAPRLIYNGVVHQTVDSPQQQAGAAWLDTFKDRGFSDSAGLMFQVLGQYKSMPIEQKVSKTVTVRSRPKTAGKTTVRDLLTKQQTKTKVVTTTETSTEQWWAREVLSVGYLQTSMSAREFLKRWIEARRLLLQSASFRFQNIPATNWIDTTHIHPVAGVSPEYEGFWMVRNATHRWARGVHTAYGQVARVPSSRPLAEVLL